MTSTIITALIGLFCTLASSAATFLLTRRKYNEEVNSQQIENMSKSFDIYKKTMNDTLAMQNDRIKQLQEENNDLRQQVHNLQMQMAQMFSAMCYDTTCSLRKTGLATNPHITNDVSK